MNVLFHTSWRSSKLQYILTSRCYQTIRAAGPPGAPAAGISGNKRSCRVTRVRSVRCMHNLKTMLPIGKIELEDVERVVERAVGPKARLVAHRVEPFTKSRQFGIMGEHYELAVEVDVGDEAEEEDGSERPLRSLKFFLKTPPESAAWRDALLDDWVSHEEVHFFAQLHPLLVQECRERGVEPWSPACYLARPEALVLEDLRSQGYAVRRNRIFGGDELRAALASLARFHASSLLLQRRLGRPLNELFPAAFREKTFTEVGKGGRCNRLGFESMRWMAERLGLTDGARMLPRILARLCELVEPRTGECNVICHGDLWRSNVMLRDEPSSSISCRLVDFQMLRYASPTSDVAMLLYVRTTPEFRRSSELEMLEHYYSILRGSLGDAPPPSYRAILEDYRRRKLLGMAYSALRWPPVVFAELLGDPLALESWYFHDRLAVYRKAMDEDPAYEAQLRAYLLELFVEAESVL